MKMSFLTLSNRIETCNVEILNDTIPKHIKVQIWEPSTDDVDIKIINNSINKVQGIMILYDITVWSTFIHLKELIKLINNQEQFNIPIVIVGNKVDLLFKRKVSSRKSQSFAKKYNIPYYETSVKSGENINEAFSKLFQLVYKSTKYNSKFDVIQANNSNLNLDV